MNTTPDKPAPKTYELGIEIQKGTGAGFPFILCSRCRLKSYNRNDLDTLYCGRCHKFHESLGITAPRNRS